MADEYQSIFIKEDWTSAKWRLNNLYYIVDPKGNKIPFRMKPEQEHFYDNLWYWNIILKARQLGWTTLIALMALDQCLFTANYSAAIIAHKKDDAEKIFEKKIKFAYTALPWSLKDERKIIKDPAGELWLSNGSTCIVSTSARSGTLQFLHISEFGKICANRPDIAEEIVTGSFPAVAPGNFTFVESTAEGNDGHFHDMVQRAVKKAESGERLTRLDFRLHFYGWYQRPENTLPDDEAALVKFTKEQNAYFTKSETETGITYTTGQKAWYVVTAEKQGDKMFRENPATIKEAFEASVKGLIYGDQMTLIRKNLQICTVPWAPGYPVNTSWDLGHSKGNAMAVWCHQQVGMQHRLIRFHQAEGEGVPYFANYLKGWGYTFGVHYMPHDAENVQENETAITTRADILRGLISGDVSVGTRIKDREDGIEQTRVFLPQCWIDRQNCDEGIKALDNYRRRWNNQLQQHMTEPLHNWASNGADALRELAQQLHVLDMEESDFQAARQQRRSKGRWRA